jgi:hypothetical protein
MVDLRGETTSAKATRRAAIRASQVQVEAQTYL